MTTLPDTTTLVLEPQGSVLTIWFNRPEARNALSADMVDELGAVLDAIRDERSVRTVILRGKGGFFCAGGDIKGFKSDLQGGEPDERDRDDGPGHPDRPLPKDEVALLGTAPPGSAQLDLPERGRGRR